jgi:hypothetical protein
MLARLSVVRVVHGACKLPLKRGLRFTELPPGFSARMQLRQGLRIPRRSGARPEPQSSSPTEPVAIDRDGPEEVLLFFSGEVVRGYPRSRWTMHVVDGTGSRRGPFVMDHTPWGA